MESVGAFPEGEWESLSKMFSAEDLEFTPHFLGQCSFNNNPNFEGTMFPISEANNNTTTETLLFHTLESLNSNFQYLSQESSQSSANSGTQESCYLSQESYNINNNNNNDGFSESDFLMNQCNNFPVFADNATPNQNNVLKRNAYDSGFEDKSNKNATEPSDQNPKKKPRVQRSRKNGNKSQAKPRGQKGKVEEEISNTSSYSSEDENASQENNNGEEATDALASTTVVNLNGKARASRGSATDPQSLYARKRRERINERLKILQNIVPNGTKVDISTMLEEAVNYVRFLQLQIKLLSSDDMWMYAPIAYNGMDIGLTKKLSQLV